MHTFSKKSVENLIAEHGGNYFGNTNGKDVWILEDLSLIQLPASFKRISFNLLKTIALDQLGISPWEFDYWLGESHN